MTHCTKTVLIGSLAFLGLGLATSEVSAQGCVAVRGGGACLLHPQNADAQLMGGDWQVALGYRWLHSFRHFVGDVEQVEREKLGNQVINDSHFFDLSISYAFTPRFSSTVVLPFVFSDRSSLYEHDRVNRGHSQANGLADVRAAFYGWVLDPTKPQRGNLQVGLGFKAPTGEYAATDTFNTTNGPALGYVDQSIQPGDGGWGMTMEFYGWLSLFKRANAYLQGFYLANPMDINGTPTTSGTSRRNPYEQVTSIPDAYMLRGGVDYLLWAPWGVTLSFGGRVEGVPVQDLIGDDNGFRRPGYAVSVEPALSMMKSGWTVSVSTPVAVYRNRERSVADFRWSADTGVYRHGDAAFADYTVLATVARSF